MRRPRTSSLGRTAGLLLAGIGAIVGIVGAGCTSREPDHGAAKSPATTDSAVTDSAAATTAAATTADTSQASLLERADGLVAAIARRDWDAVAAVAHPERGVRFSPYGHVEPAGECTVTLARRELASLATDSTTRCWGHFDGTGDPIRMTFSAYHERFVYDRDYVDARRGEPDERLGQGNTLSNLPDAFGAEATFVEYHVPGTEQYGGMDWGSLRLVFVPTADGWRLVGIVHDQWTI